jgi:hypothetical protein
MQVGGLVLGPLLINNVSRQLINVSSFPPVLNCFYCNAQSLKNKLIELNDILFAGNYNIVCFSESWLAPIVTDGLLDPSGQYTIYRKDRRDMAVFAFLSLTLFYQLL